MRARSTASAAPANRVAIFVYTRRRCALPTGRSPLITDPGMPVKPLCALRALRQPSCLLQPARRTLGHRRPRPPLRLPAGRSGRAATPAPPKPVPAQLPDVLAKVNGQDVKKADFDMLVKDMELGQGPIPADRRDEVLRGTLDRLITYTVLSQEAKTRKVTATDAEVDDRLKQMQQQFPNEDAFKKALGERNMTIERLRSRHARQPRASTR